MSQYLGTWKIDDILRWTVITNAVTTGAATDADTNPTWRVYEDATSTPVTTGSMTGLDTANTAGFYQGAMTLAASIGYEVGKNYNIYVQATVGGVIGAEAYSFQIEPNSVTLGSTSVAAIQTAITANSIGAVTLGSTSVTAIQTAVTAGSIGAVTVNSTSVAAVQAAVTANSIGPVTVNATSRAAIVDEVWDEPKSGHTTADTYGEYLDATVSGISGGGGDTTVSGTAIAAIADAVWDEARAGHVGAGTFGEGVPVSGSVTLGSTSVAAIQTAVTANSIGAVTVGATSQAAITSAITANSIGAVTVNATSQAAIIAGVTANSIGPVTVNATSQAAIVDGVWDEPKSGHTTADTYGEYLDSTTSAIKGDTADIAAVKSKTDSLTFTVANNLNANIRYVNGVSVTGNGQSGSEWGPGS